MHTSSVILTLFYYDYENQYNMLCTFCLYTNLVVTLKLTQILQNLQDKKYKSRFRGFEPYGFYWFIVQADLNAESKNKENFLVLSQPHPIFFSEINNKNNNLNTK